MFFSNKPCEAPFANFDVRMKENLNILRFDVVILYGWNINSVPTQRVDCFSVKTSELILFVLRTVRNT
jgi:hypothetical protein